MKKDGGSREAVVAGVMAELASAAAPGDRVLVADDDDGAVEAAFSARGARVSPWRRRALRGRDASPGPPEPPPGGFDVATLRLPKARRAFEMALHLCAARVAPGGRVFVYGANDEGIQSAPKRVAELLGPTASVSVKRHCRVLRAERPAEIPGLRGDLGAWRSTFRLDLPGGPAEWVTYPGLFAEGRLDPGTALLLDALPELEPGARVLDFACGTGVVGKVVARRQPAARVDLADVDALAVAAAAENVPGGRPLLGDGWGAVPSGETYDLIVSNPPFHAGKGRDYGVVDSLLAGAPARLVPGGGLLLVVQRMVHLDEALAARFPRVRVLHADARYRVYAARTSAEVV